MTNVFNDMPQVNYPKTGTSQVSNNTQAAQGQAQQTPIPAAKVEVSPKQDTVELSNTQKKGPVKKVKGFIANIKKFFASTFEYTKGTFKGIATGAVAGSLIYTAGSIFNGVRAKSAAKVGEEALKSLKKFPSKTLAIVAAGIALAVNLWNSSLNATERQSQIDHRWTGHKQ